MQHYWHTLAAWQEGTPRPRWVVAASDGAQWPELQQDKRWKRYGQFFSKDLNVKDRKRYGQFFSKDLTGPVVQELSDLEPQLNSNDKVARDATRKKMVRDIKTSKEKVRPVLLQGFNRKRYGQFFSKDLTVNDRKRYGQFFSKDLTGGQSCNKTKDGQRYEDFKVKDH
ncbi:hypothetical protein E2562_038426 [Oryza meyeriana var. granulata]|uniref:Uncharacterized protein n=1 Tax=Oryza meyeriana var. granulata TaxID=110450 RepID=A0A6G1BQB5_9ORYZ|nr:hypothetical protein E2562_038426 [Oryza meyeriana var. granulata]